MVINNVLYWSNFTITGFNFLMFEKVIKLIYGLLTIDALDEALFKFAVYLLMNELQ